MKKAAILLLFTLACINLASAQIRLSSINVDDWIKKNFSGQGVVIGNITHKGYPLSILSFTSSPNILQMHKGLILSSGNSFNVAGYNNSHNQSSTFTDVSVPASDPDLAKMIREKLYDLCSIEFDFVPMDNSLQFNYQFGSDEYPEYVDSPYNDIFAFIVSDEATSQNIAMVPGAGVPVSINTVNFKTNQDHFIDNNLYRQVVIKRHGSVKSTYRGTLPGRVLRSIASVFGDSNYGANADRVVIAPDPELIKTLDANLYRNLRYDGITKKLMAQTYVTPYKKYHLKIVISDNIYDSGVFIEDRSLTSRKDVNQPDFKEYPDLSQVIDPNLILQGKKLEEIIPENHNNLISQPAPLLEPTVQTPPAEIPVLQTEVILVPVAKDVGVPPLENAVIYFDFDKSTISDTEMKKLKDAMALFQTLRDHYTFRITGHTDSIGSMEYNVALSSRRNQSVIEALNQMLGPRNTLAQPKSFTEPVAENTTERGRQKNRRVEIIFERRGE
jgi:outer membrane protein OmpA-like peptidoglycan-associated protein